MSIVALVQFSLFLIEIFIVSFSGNLYLNPSKNSSIKLINDNSYYLTQFTFFFQAQFVLEH